MSSLNSMVLGGELKTLAFGSIGAAYMGVGTPFSYQVRNFLFLNLTDSTVMISLDGIEDFFPLVANGHWSLDVTTNRTIREDFFGRKGQRFYVKWLGAAGTVGAVYITGVFGDVT